ncbi:MAG: protein-methionine-sulfoxide reductase catalytic subunit MsrP [Rhodobacteraceae bacterium]|nr:protein-methionine-sulfoxide reductase catalytic subunit MsrP [Paracoccaceae bacterium]
MTYRFKTELRYSDVTPKPLWLNRRQLISGAAAGIAVGVGGATMAPAITRNSRYSVTEEPTELDVITQYNNFYEFGTRKEDPSRNAHRLTTSPWEVKIDGMVAKPGTYSYEDIVGNATLEERIYRLRCVEAWSMVVPWVGFQLSDLIERVEPQSGAKYVAFETLYRPEEMNGQASRLLDWPYREGLRLDEAMHPLTLLATGLYGEDLPNQNGAPIRLVVPWKYGFKSIKSIVRISFVSDMPPTTWNMQAPREYGFYSNVNPMRSHPRWSQATERRVGDGLFAKRRETLMFNGYGDEVAGMYSDMDLMDNY